MRWPRRLGRLEVGRGEDPLSQSRGVGIEPGYGGATIPAAHDADLGPRVALAHQERAAAVPVARVLRRWIARTDVEARQIRHGAFLGVPHGDLLQFFETVA